MTDRYASLKQGLVGCWIPSVSGSGLLLPDLSGRGNNGSLVNMDASDWVSASYGRALDFDGSNDYVSCSGISLPQDQSYTACCFVRMPNVTDAERRAFFSTAGSPATFTVSLEWGNDGINGRNNKFQTFTETTTDPQESFATSTTSAVANVWYHIASRVNTATDQISIFVNGIEEASKSFAGLLTKAGVGFNIGTYRLADGRFMEGVMDDVRLYSRALSEPEIRLLASDRGIGFKPAKKLSFFSTRYTYQPPKAKVFEGVRVRDHDYSSLRNGLVGAWCPSLANGGSGNLLPDQSQRGNHGVLTNMSASAWVSSGSGRALDFDGSDDYVSVPHSQSLNVTGAYCLAFWIRGNDTSNKVIFEKGSNLSLVFQPNGANQLYYLDGNASPANVSNIVTSFLDGNWHHVAALFDGSNRFLFVDGLQLHTSSISSASANTSPFVMGSRSGLFPFIGSLDDVRVYSRVVTEPEIKLLASRRGIGLQPSPTKFIAKEKKTGLRRILMTGQT